MLKKENLELQCMTATQTRIKNVQQNDFCKKMFFISLFLALLYVFFFCLCFLVLILFIILCFFFVSLFFFFICLFIITSTCQITTKENGRAAF